MIPRSDPAPILIAGGGTAGHLLPGIAIADALVALGSPAASIRFVGGNRGVERELLTTAGYQLDELPGRGIQRRVTITNVAAAWGLMGALVKGVRLVRHMCPRVVVVLGGYASFACGVGAVIWRVPLVLVEQNARAGAVNRALRWFAKAAAVSFPDTDLPRARVTGNPLRTEVIEMAERLVEDRDATRHHARRELGLPENRYVVAVATGSLGSRRVNTAIRSVVEQWADRSDVAVRHVIGRRDFQSFIGDLPTQPAHGLVYQPVEYEDHMDQMLAAADVAVTRAGGGVAELAALGVPAILVPLPVAPRDHQRANADHLVRSGAAILIDDEDCTGERLAGQLDRLLRDDGLRAEMSAKMRSHAHLDAARNAALLVIEVARDH